MFTQRLGVHLLSEDIKNPCHFECPHRLSDKLLKSSATRLSLTVARWRILRFPLSESTVYFQVFSAGILRRTPLTRRLVCRCSVSVEAHYREFFGSDKHKIQKNYRSLTFQAKSILRDHFCLVFKQKRAPEGPFLLFCDLLHCHNSIIFHN